MIIQCPQCQSRYRIKDPSAANKAATATCPKCHERFVAEAHQVREGGATAKSILVVDDAQFFRELIFDILSGQEYQLVEAENAQQAWQAITTQSFDLIIVDVNLPEVSGYAFIQKVRQQPQFIDLPILCISGIHRREDDFAKAIRAGANDFTTKSFNPDDFRSRVRKLVHG